MPNTAVSSNQFLANLRYTKLVTWNLFLFYIACCSRKNTKYYIIWECIYSLRFPTCRHTAVSSNQFLSNVRCKKLVAWNQFLFYIDCCIGKTLNIKYSESVFIALGIQHIEHSGFKQLVSSKLTLHETGCFETVPLLYNLLQWKNTNYYIFWECMFNPSYPACKAHASYYHVSCPALQYFQHYLINRTIFGKILLNTKCVL